MGPYYIVRAPDQTLRQELRDQVLVTARMIVSRIANVAWQLVAVLFLVRCVRLRLAWVLSTSMSGARHRHGSSPTT